MRRFHFNLGHSIPLTEATWANLHSNMATFIQTIERDFIYKQEGSRERETEMNVMSEDRKQMQTRMDAEIIVYSEQSR